MGQRLVIEIKKNGRVLANCYYHWEGFTLTALGRAKDIIDNYNKHLSNSDLPEEMLLLRMFQEQNADGNISKCCAKMEDKSREYMRGRFAGYNVSELIGSYDSAYGRIALVSSDMENNIDNLEGALLIDLDTKTLTLVDLVRTYEEEEYCEIMDYDIDEFDIESLPEIDFSFSSLRFNEISEAIDFVQENLDGWIDDGVICTPVE